MSFARAFTKVQILPELRVYRCTKCENTITEVLDEELRVEYAF